MPELPQDSSSPPPPPIFIPSIDPTAWEEFPVFRETFMMYITPPHCGEALRTACRLPFDGGKQPELIKDPGAQISSDFPNRLHGAVD